MSSAVCGVREGCSESNSGVNAPFSLPHYDINLLIKIVKVRSGVYLNKQTNKPRTSRVGFPLFFISFHRHSLKLHLLTTGFPGGEREKEGVLRFLAQVSYV